MINIWAILVSGIASMIIGAVWYSPSLFGKLMVESMTEQMKANSKATGMKKQYVAQFILALITAYVLAHFVLVLQITSVSAVLALAFWVWLGFQFTLAAGSVLWEGKSKKLFIANALHNLITLWVVGIIIVLM